MDRYGGDRAAFGGKSPQADPRGAARRIAGWVILAVLILALFPAYCRGEQTGTEAPALQLEFTEITLKKGRTRTIKVSVTGLQEKVKTVKRVWTSSDPDVADFLDGAIRAKNGGEAILLYSVTLSDGTELQAECRVTVTVPVSELQAASRSLQVMKGDVFAPEIKVLPENATNPAYTFRIADGNILRSLEDGTLEALEIGKTTVTAVSAENPDKQVRVTVTVTRRIGKTDRELKFQGIPWESDHEACMRLLKERGFIQEQSQSRSNYSDSVWHWPKDDLLFSRGSAWRTLPVAFSDQRTGAERVSLDPQKTIGGFMPQRSTLIYLNGLGADGEIDPDITRLIGACFSFDNRHEEGVTIFLSLLERLETEYGEFTRYVPKDMSKYYPEIYQKLKENMKDARSYGIQDLGDGLYLGECVICTIRGREHTGIMLSMDMNETVTLFYGRTDAEEMIGALEEALRTEREAPEDAGV